MTLNLYTNPGYLLKFTLEDFILNAISANSEAARLGTPQNKDLDLFWSYIHPGQEFASSMTDDEQLMFACFVLLAEGRELPV